MKVTDLLRSSVPLDAITHLRMPSAAAVIAQLDHKRFVAVTAEVAQGSNVAA